jgi:hypothetical protein
MASIVLATEDELSEQVGLSLANEAGLQVGLCLRKGGNGYLRSRLSSFCQMARTQTVFVITDLDQIQTPAMLIADWFGKQHRPDKLLFRVAVREIESWLIADHLAIRHLFGQKAAKLPNSPDELPDAKQTLLRLAQFAPRSVRDDLVGARGSVASQGIGYNARLCEWVRETWRPALAAERSPSLAKARAALAELPR